MLKFITSCLKHALARLLILIFTGLFILCGIAGIVLCIQYGIAGGKETWLDYIWRLFNENIGKIKELIPV